MPIPSRATAAVCSLLLVLAAQSAAGQAQPAEVQRYGFITVADDADALWTNPGALALRPGTGFVSDYVFDGSFRRNAFRQLMAGFRLNGFAVGYRHDEFPEEERVLRAQADEYRLGIGVGSPAFALGGAFHWHRVGPRASAWDVGAIARPARWLSLGAVWRDIGSPEIGGVAFEDRVVPGVSLRPLGELATVSWQGEFGRASRTLLGHTIGARARLPAGIELFGHMDLDGGRATGAAIGLRAVGPNSAFHVIGRTRRESPMRLTVGSQTYSPPAEATVPVSRRIASMTVGGAYVDFPPDGFSLAAGGPAIQPLLTALAQARRDPEVRGVILRVQPLAGSFIGPVRAVHEELRREVLALREAGKPVVAYLDGQVSDAELFVASAASEVIAPRLAMIMVTGVHFELQRLRRTFERFGIEWDATTAGELKSTFHTQYTDSSTAEQAAWIDMLVGRAFDETVSTVAAGRNMDPARVRELVDSPPLSADDAVQAGYLDAVGDYEFAEERIRELTGVHPIRELRARTFRTERWGVQPAVVVVNAHGQIVQGRSRRNPLTGSVTLGSETLSRQIRAAADVPGVRAIVLRVNSPGGSAVASDEILSAVRWVQTERELPVIASMADVAASGGYWISMIADTIVAERLSVTGSIGVVAAIPVIEQLLDTLDVNTERWQRGEHAGVFSITRHRSAEEMALIDRSMDVVYQVFLDEVAQARGLSQDSLRSLAGGRVWFGADALPAGLIDEFGGLRDAIRIAAERAGVADDYRVLRVRGPGSPALTQLFRYVGLGIEPGTLLPRPCVACLTPF